MLGEAGIYIAGGSESMSRAPFVMAKSYKAFSRTLEVYDTSIGWRFVNPVLKKMHYPYGMGETAENVAGQWKISREAQDRFAHESQLKYQAAKEKGLWEEEITAVEVPQRKGDPLIVREDEHPRLTSIEKLATLRPAFKKDGTVTAGNASGINDGASALLVVSEDIVRRFDLKPLASVRSMAIAGVDPAVMGIGPVPATRKALKRAGLKMQDIGLIELNEAFASQSIACIRELDLDPAIVNVNGGAIAIGHPLGCSGARISTTLLYEMQRRQSLRFGLATMCVGVGQGAAVIFEKV